MTKEEFLALQKRNKEEESNRSEDQRTALNEARKRHAKKVRSEILASYAAGKRKGNTE